MDWAKPKHERTEVDAAGATLVGDASDAELEHALIVINNWRAAHAFPLNTLQMNLRNKAKRVRPKGLVAQRIKRLSAIDEKLRRMPHLRLSEMQDIGGCRAVVRSVAQVDALVELCKGSAFKHKLDDEDDYIREPKRSGYRSVHLIYRYHSDRNQTYEGLKIEMQFRSILQHAWAAAVETVGTFMQQALKSSQGEKEWLRFFALMGTAIALRERSPLVPDTPTNETELVQELREYNNQLDVEGHLAAYGAAVNILRHPGLKGARYFLLDLDPGTKTIKITGYKASQLGQASQAYQDAERRILKQPGTDAVLVSVESLAALRRAYPNYFLDTHLFLREVKRAIS